MAGNEGSPEASAAFREHFTDPVYDDVGDEFAPFGSDEGSDLLASWVPRRDELGPSGSIATVLGTEPEQLRRNVAEMEDIDDLETAMFIRSAAFVLLRLSGHLGDEDRQLALDALEFEIGLHRELDVSGLLTQRDDLLSWRNP